MAESSGERKKGLGDLVDGISHLIDLVDKIQDRGEEGINKSGEFKSERGGVAGRYGLSIKTAPSGQADSDIDRFRVPKEEETLKAPNKSESRRELVPFVDVIDQGNHLTIVAEIPGASKDSIDIAADGNMLALYASAQKRVYRKTIQLPYPVNPEPSDLCYINGIFSAVLHRVSLAD